MHKNLRRSRVKQGVRKYTNLCVYFSKFYIDRDRGSNPTCTQLFSLNAL